MAKVAVIIADFFEDSEYTEPVKAFTKVGHEIVTIGLQAGSTVTWKNKGTRVKVDITPQNSSVDAFDALLIPGATLLIS